MTIAAAFAMSHAPGIVAWKDRPPKETAARLYAGYDEAGERIRAAGADAVVVVTGEHFANFFEVIPAFYVNIGESVEGPVEPWLGVPRRTIPGNASLAKRILDTGLADGFDLAYGHDLVLDHGSVVPLELLRIPHDMPVVPLIVNTLVEPMPTLERCRAFGEFLGRTLGAAEERLAIVGAGGLSHWPGMAEAGRMSPSWDRTLLAALERGDRDVLWDLPTEGYEDAGPGAKEVRNWTIVGAAAPGGSGETLAYEPIGEWATGCAVFDFMPRARVTETALAG